MIPILEATERSAQHLSWPFCVSPLVLLYDSIVHLILSFSIDLLSGTRIKLVGEFWWKMLLVKLRKYHVEF